MGWHKKILRVNLTEGSCTPEPLNMEWAAEYLGQRGLATKYLIEEIDPKVDPLSPDNKLIFATGPLTGTAASTSGRYSVITKGALTGAIACSNSGGYFGAELKFAGWDMVIFEGKSERPVYLYINNDKAELLSADGIWGKSVWETDEILHQRHQDPQLRVSAIGQSGEAGVLFACIVNDLHRAAGFEVPRYWHAEVGGLPALAIARFDRDANGTPLPQESLYSILAAGARDIERNTDGSLDRIARVIDLANPVLITDKKAARLHLFRRLVLALLSGNGDLHLDNLSLLGAAGGAQFSPVYDPTPMRAYSVHNMLCAVPFGGYGESAPDGDPLPRACAAFAANLGLGKAAVQDSVADLLAVSADYPERVEAVAPDAATAELAAALLTQEIGSPGRVTADHVIVTNNTGDGLNFRGKTAITLRNCLVADNGRDGVYFYVDNGAANQYVYNCTIADNGRDGVTMFRDKPVQVVITDIIMPEKDGIETILDLRREHPQLKVIAISGGGRSTPENYLHSARLLGADRAIRRPSSIPSSIAI